MRVLESARSESKLLARRDRGRPVLGLGVKKLMALPLFPRRERPVDDRFFFFISKSLSLGKLPLGIDVGGVDIVGSRGDPGDGGVLDRVVVADRLMENRRLPLLGGAGAPLWTVILLEGSIAGGFWRSVTPGFDVAVSMPFICCPGAETCELDRRNMFDIVRLKLLVEPRVERRDEA